MDASEFEELLYNILSKEPFANHRIDMTDENEEYTTSGCMSVRTVDALPICRRS